MKTTFKTLDSEDCILNDARIDIWHYSLHTEFPGASALLSEDELSRAKRYHFARHQRRFTVARAILRLILARYVHAPATELLFTYNQHGKPELVNNTASIQFNLSHAGDTALLAVGKNFPVGIDLEFFSARPYEGIGKQLFSAHENLALSQASQTLKPLIFFHIWAQKEAFIKACGMGLAYPTQQFDVSILPGETQHIIDALHEKTWQMRSFMPEIACSAALCSHPLVEEFRYLKLNNLTTLLPI